MPHLQSQVDGLVMKQGLRLRDVIFIAIALVIAAGAWAVWQWRHSPEAIERAENEATRKFWEDRGEKVDPSDLSSTPHN